MCLETDAGKDFTLQVSYSTNYHNVGVFYEITWTSELSFVETVQPCSKSDAKILNTKVPVD